MRYVLKLRQISWWLRVLLATLLPPRSVSVPGQPPQTFLLRRNPFLNKRIYSGTYEPMVSELVAKEAPRSEIFVNVAANVGFHSCHAASLGVNVIAVEPDRLNFSQIRSNRRLNGFLFAIHRVALGEKPGKTLLFGGNTGASHIRGWAGQPEVKRTVSTQTLDQLVAGRSFNSIMLLIDVEGAELGVLRGGRQLLTTVKSALMCIEISKSSNHPSGVNPQRLDTLMVADSFGFEIWGLNSDSKRILTVQEAHQSDIVDFMFSKNWPPN